MGTHIPPLPAAKFRIPLLPFLTMEDIHDQAFSA